jgi:hypothetical protein
MNLKLYGQNKEFFSIFNGPIAQWRTSMLSTFEGLALKAGADA